MSEQQGEDPVPNGEAPAPQQPDQSEPEEQRAPDTETAPEQVQGEEGGEPAEVGGGSPEPPVAEPSGEQEQPSGEVEEAAADEPVKSEEVTTEPDQPSGDTAEPDQPSAETAEPDQPSGDTAEPDQPSAETAEPDQPSGETTEPEQPSAETAEPDQPSGDTAESKPDEEWIVVEPPPPQSAEENGTSKQEGEGVANGDKTEAGGSEGAEPAGAEGGRAVSVEVDVGGGGEAKTEKRPLSPGDDTKIGEYLRQLQLGLDLVKIKKSKWYGRIYRLDEDLLSISWNSRSKKGAKAKIFISCIKEVRTGRSTDSFKVSSSTHPEELCFSIVYLDSAAYKTLDLAALSAMERSACVEALEALMAESKGEHKSKVQERWLRDMFQEADRNGDGTLDVKEVLRMMKSLNVGTSTKILKKKFKAADQDGNYDGKLNFDEFCTLFRELAGRPEIQRLFSLASSRLDWLAPSDLQKFLQLEQGECYSLEECEGLVQKYEPTDAGKAKGFLSIDGFTQFLLGEECDMFNRRHRSVYQDMSLPLSHYFIASSHNTYLMEDQLKGPSSTEAYIRALRKGCRCVELDCWDGDDEPVIYHGHTLTSKILFRDAIAAIKEHAFVASEYPVILSIENHCSVPQQNKMAEILKEVLQDALYNEPRDEEAHILPSPEKLKGKILIKGKKLKQELEEANDDGGDVSDEDEAAEIDSEQLAKEEAKPSQEEPAKSGEGTGKPAEEEGGGASKASEEKGSPTKSRATRSFSFKSRQRKQPAASPPPSQPAKKIKLSKSLSACINYVQSVHFKSFDGIDSALCYHMSSFGEGSAFKISGNDPHKFVRYNRRQISRIYPGGARVTSTNYNPVPMWNCGSQIVALNYQTSCSAMDYNDGKFLQNGGSGYILKPAVMNEELSHFDPRQKLSRSGAKIITLKIVSGQQLPKPGDKDGEIIDPYVVINIVGAPEDTVTFKTKVVEDNGFNPTWNESFQAVVKHPELALVRFKVMDKDRLNQDDFIGQFTLPFESMVPGYRHIHLLRNGGNKIENSSLFVHVTIHDFVGTARQPPFQQHKLRSTVKVKRHREYPEVHVVGQGAVAEQLRTGGALTHKAVDLREDFLFALLHFNESCGCSAQAAVSDCMQLFSLRVKAKGIKVTLHSVGEEPKVYKISLTSESAVPDSVLHIVEAFDLLNHSIQRLLAEGSKVGRELETVYSKAKDAHESLKGLLGLNPKTAERNMEHYCHAMFTFNAEQRQLKASRDSAADVLTKLNESAVAVGFEVKTEL